MSPTEAPTPSTDPKLHPVTRLFVWLAGADDETLAKCPKWEQRRYEAFGATVLVPTLFGMVASAYAVSTLTPNAFIIVPISLLWGFIILAIDRALLSSYRPGGKSVEKASQFTLRFVVAVLMGITISHPLTLLLFQDAIASRVEKGREAEIQTVREGTLANKKAISDKITETQASLAAQYQRYQDSLGGKFLEGSATGEVAKTAPGGSPLEEQQRLKSQAERARIAEIETEMATLTENQTLLREEITRWQAEFEKEISGSRSGVAGVGPRAEIIRKDQIEPRRAEMARLTGLVDTLSRERQELATAMADSEKAVREGNLEAAAKEEARTREDRARIADLKRELEKQKLSLFVDSQKQLTAQMEAQLAGTNAELQRLQDELAGLSQGEASRIEAIRKERRADILTQSIVLHEDLFAESPMALAAWLVLALLFTLVDTIPLVVKLFSKQGLYDLLLANEEEAVAALLKEGEIVSMQHYKRQHVEFERRNLPPQAPVAQAPVAVYRVNAFNGVNSPEQMTPAPTHRMPAHAVNPTEPKEESPPITAPAKLSGNPDDFKAHYLRNTEGVKPPRIVSHTSRKPDQSSQ